MSVAVMSAVWNLDLPPTEKLVMLAFADYANDEGQCYPSTDRIAHKSGISARHARRVVKEMIRRGLIQIEEPGGGRGHRRIVRVCPEKGDKMSVFRSRERGTSDAERGTRASTEPLEEPSVEHHASNEAGEPDVENLHARFGELARTLGGNRTNAGRWIKWALNRSDPDEAERIMRGTLSLRERGAIDYFVKPSEPCAPGVLTSRIEGQPIVRYAEPEYFRVERSRKGPRRTNGTPERVNTEGVA